MGTTGGPTEAPLNPFLVLVLGGLCRAGTGQGVGVLDMEDLDPAEVIGVQALERLSQVCTRRSASTASVEHMYTHTRT
jgi:hypothetical protein